MKKELKNYHTQYLAQLRAVQELHEDGWGVFRIYTNRRLVNLFAYNETDLKLIKIRTTNKDETKLTGEEIAGMKILSLPKNVRIEIWVWVIGKGWFKQIIK